MNKVPTVLKYEGVKEIYCISFNIISQMFKHEGTIHHFSIITKPTKIGHLDGSEMPSNL